MDEKEKSGKLVDRDQRVTRVNKALRENLRKRKVEAANPDGVMQRRASAINKRTGPKLRRPDKNSSEE